MCLKLSRRIYHSKIYLVLYSLVCTVWLIFRSGKKPTRLSYPCQQASASQTLWLWSYLAGSGSSLLKSLFGRECDQNFISDQLFELKLLKRLLFSVILFSAMITFFVNMNKGIFPSTANINKTSNYQYLLTQKKSAKSASVPGDYTVTLVGSNYPTLSQPASLDAILTYDQVKEIVWTALDLDDSNESLRDVINDGDWVVIKPNIVTAPLIKTSGQKATNYWFNGVAHKGQNTDLRVVKAVIEYLIHYENVSRISIAEGSAEWGKLGEPETSSDFAMDGWTVHWAEFGNLSYEQIRNDINSVHPDLVDLVDLSYDSYRYVNVPDPFGSGINGMQRTGYYMPATVLDCDKWIDVAAMKTHSIASVTLAMKIRIGCLANQGYGSPQSSYGELHRYGEFGVLQAINDMYSFKPADYAIVECFWGTEGQGPQWGDDLKRNFVVAGHNAVAVDVVSSATMGFNPWDLEYLHLAEMKNFGSLDLNKINMAGNTIDQVDYDFNKPLMSPGNTSYIGRANRNWLFNGIHQGTDLNYEYVENESTIQPFEGMNSNGFVWEVYNSPVDRMNIKDHFGSAAEQCVVYGFTYINSEQAINANLKIGVDDGVKVWLNGNEVFSEDTGGAYIFPEHIVPVSLNEGVNTLMCKLLNYSGDFEFRLNVCDHDGDTPMEIEYALSNTNSASISGYVNYYSNSLPVGNTSLNLAGGITDTGITDETGFYEFKFLTNGLNYAVSPNKTNESSSSAILTYDAAITAKIVVGLIPSPGENVLLAADVDENGIVQMYDAALIARYAVGLPPLPDAKVGHWQFNPDTRNYQPLVSDQMNQDFAGILNGDVDGNWAPNLDEDDLQKGEDFSLPIEAIVDETENNIIIPFANYQGEKIYSCDVALKYDTRYLEFDKVRNGACGKNLKIVVNDLIAGTLRIGCYSAKPISESGVYLEVLLKMTDKSSQVGEISIETHRINAAPIRKGKAAFTFPKDVKSLPNNFLLENNYPNPFNSNTKIGFALPEPCQVRLKIYDILGREVETLIDENLNTGIHQIHWNGRDSDGKKVSSGVYFYEMRAKGFQEIKKMIIVQ